MMPSSALEKTPPPSASSSAPLSRASTAGSATPGQRSPLPPEGRVTQEMRPPVTEMSSTAGSSPKKERLMKRKKPSKVKKKKLVLFLVDPQCDYLQSDGSMPVMNADMDAIRTADMIKAHLSEISEIFVSLNSRHRTHISNPVSWVSSLTGETPEPYTVVSKDDVTSRKYRARVPTLQKGFSEYVTALEALGRPPLVLWPDHCLMGSEGMAVIPDINDALQEWALHNMTTVEYIIKGTNCGTEMYSALSAEVPQPGDPSTELDRTLVARLQTADRVLIAGQPLTHAIKHTVSDILRTWTKPNPNPDRTNSIYLLKDCCSALPGEEREEEAFLAKMSESGVTLANSDAHSTFYFQTPEELAAREAAILKAKLDAEAKVREIARKKAEKEAAAAAAVAKAEADRLQKIAEKKARRAAAKARKKAEAEAARLKKKAEAEAARLKKLEEERLAELQRIEDERLAALQAQREAEEEFARIQKAKEVEAARLQKLADEEAMRVKRAAEEAEAARLKAEAEEAARAKAAAEEAARIAAEEAEAARIQKAKEEEEARIKKEEEEEAARLAAEEAARIAAFKAECNRVQGFFKELADEARCDEVMALLAQQLSREAAPVTLRAFVFSQMTEPDAASSLINCLTMTTMKCISGYSKEMENRMLRTLELLLLLLQCDGYAEEDQPGSKVHMAGLKARQLELVQAECCEVLFTIMGLGDMASDQLFTTTARVVGLVCCASDIRAVGSPAKKAKKSKKPPKTHVNSLCQDSFVPYSKNLLAQLKVHGSRRNSSALASVCNVILSIGQDNPATQRRLLDVQAVSLLLDQLKALPTSYADISDESPEDGNPSPRQIVLSQKSLVIQALRLVVDPAHRRSKAVNGKVQKVLEAIRDSADENEDIKEVGNDILAKFAEAGLKSPRNGEGTDTDSPRNSPREGGDDSDSSVSVSKKESKREKRARLKREATLKEGAEAAAKEATIAEETEVAAKAEDGKEAGAELA